MLTALKGGEKCLREGEHAVLPTKDPWEEFSQVQYTSSVSGMLLRNMKQL